MFEKLENVFVERHAGYSILVMEGRVMSEPTWEVYYSKPGYAFMYAFGLGRHEKIENVFEIAKGNIWQYVNLFT